MSLELIATGFAMGLAGAGHCAVMCGPLCGRLGLRREDSPGTAATPPAERSVVVRFERSALSAASPPVGLPDDALLALARGSGPAWAAPDAGRGQRAARFDDRLVVFLASRVASYAAGGAVVAASVSLLATLGESFALLRPFWVLLHVAVLAVGLWLLVAGRQPPWLVDAFERLGRRGPAPAGAAAAGRPRPGRLRNAAVAGSAWVVLPCGLLQSALVTASLASSPWAGGAVMAAFALASSIGLVGAPALVAMMRRFGGPLGERLVTRLAGALLAAAAAWALWLLSTAHLARAVCVV